MVSMTKIKLCGSKCSSFSHELRRIGFSLTRLLSRTPPPPSPRPPRPPPQPYPPPPTSRDFQEALASPSTWTSCHVSHAFTDTCPLRGDSLSTSCPLTLAAPSSAGSNPNIRLHWPGIGRRHRRDMILGGESQYTKCVVEVCSTERLDIRKRDWRDEFGRFCWLLAPLTYDVQELDYVIVD